MKLSSLRPAYLIPRLSQMAFVRKHPDTPWLAQSAVLFLESWLKPTDRGIEWGSGRSTTWIAQRCGHLTSIEHHGAWYQRVSENIARLGLKDRVDYRHVPIKVAGEKDPVSGKVYEAGPDVIVGNIELAEPVGHPYPDVACEIPDGSLDFALVDGSLRLACMHRAIEKLRPGGLLILDNANRFLPNYTRLGFSTNHEPRAEAVSPAWKKLQGTLSGWRAIHMSDRMWDTRSWVKPC